MVDVDAAALIRDQRRKAGLSQRELAERAGTSAAAICLYERGDRVPRVDTLQRVVAAAGGSLVIGVEADAPIDVAANARALELVLALADELPSHSSDELHYPVLRDSAA